MTNYLFNEWVFMKSAYQLALTTCKDFMKEYISKNEQLGIGQGVVMKVDENLFVESYSKPVDNGK